MAYSRQVERVLAGSLSVLPASDMLEGADSSILNNWRVDQAGVLRSRPGQTSIGGAGNYTSSIFRHGDDRYAGIYDPIGGLYWLRFGATFATGADSGFDSHPLSFAAYQEAVWVMNRAKQVRVAGGVSRAWGITAPGTEATAGVGAAGNLTGDIIYYVTFADAYGRESNPNSGSTPVTLAAEAADLTSIPTSADASVTQRHIYRSGGGIATPLRVGTIDDNTTTTYTDDLSDDVVEALNNALDFDNDPPPAARCIAGPYYGKLLAFSTAAHAARLFWTRTGRPNSFPGSDDENEGNWVDVGDDTDEGIGITVRPRFAMLYKQESVWRLIGDPDEEDPELISMQGGPVSSKAIVNAGEYDYIVKSDGVYRVDSDGETKISRKLDPIFDGYSVTLSSGQTASPINQSALDAVVLGYRPGTLYVSIPTTHTYTDETLLYDEETGLWSRYVSAYSGFRAFCWEGVRGGAPSFIAAQNGTPVIAQLDAGLDDMTQTIPLIWQSRFMDQGAPDAVKRYGEVAIEYQTTETTSPVSLTVSALFDNGTAESLGTISSATRTWARFRLGTDAQGRQARNIAIRIEGGANKTCIIYKVFIHFYAEARLARSFDSGVVDLGTHLAKTLYRAELNFECAGTFNWDLHTDLTGDAMASRETGSVTTSAGRRTKVVDFTTPRDGRFVRFMGWSSSDFQLHNLRLEIQPMGVYVDASRPYETEAIAV